MFLVLARAFPGQPETEARDGIRIVRWGGYDQGTNVRWDLVRCFWYVLRAARRLPEGDILVTNDFWMPVFAARRKKKCGKVVINANRFPKGQYGIYGGVDLIAAASGAVAEEIKEQTPRLSSKVRVLPNSIDERFLEHDSDQMTRAMFSAVGTRVRNSSVSRLRFWWSNRCTTLRSMRSASHLRSTT